jgi:hypothetical protein
MKPDEIFVQIAEPGASVPGAPPQTTTLSAAPSNPGRSVR